MSEYFVAWFGVALIMVGWYMLVMEKDEWFDG